MRKGRVKPISDHKAPFCQLIHCIRAESGGSPLVHLPLPRGRLPSFSRKLANIKYRGTLPVACRTQLQAKDRTIARILLDAPALPDQLLKDLLQGLLGQGGEHATLALIAARDVVMMRPANRPQALQAMLEAAVMDDREIRWPHLALLSSTPKSTLAVVQSGAPF